MSHNVSPERTIVLSPRQAAALPYVASDPTLTRGAQGCAEGMRVADSTFCNYNPVMADGAPFWVWDPAKDAANRRDHGLGFETATLVFDDPLAATVEDPYPYEQRWRTVGMVGAVVLMVVHTWPERNVDTGNEVGRIISARKATSRERNAYEEGTC